MFDSSLSSSITAALFDFDGTLVDASKAICSAFNETLQGRGLPVMSDDDIRPMIGRPLREMFRQVGAAETDEQVDECVAAYREAFLPRSVSLSRLLPGVGATVPRLAGKLRLGIVTNRMSDGAWRMLRAHGLADHFASVVGIERVRNAKPDPEPIALALQELGVLASHAVMVGDTVDDIAAGRSAGVRTVGVTTGAATRQQLTDAGAHKVVDGIDELAAALGL